MVPFEIICGRATFNLAPEQVKLGLATNRTLGHCAGGSKRNRSAPKPIGDSPCAPVPEFWHALNWQRLGWQRSP